jgi:hypothetical protein
MWILSSITALLSANWTIFYRLRLKIDYRAAILQ